MRDDFVSKIKQIETKKEKEQKLMEKEQARKEEELKFKLQKNHNKYERVIKKKLQIEADQEDQGIQVEKRILERNKRAHSLK